MSSRTLSTLWNIDATSADLVEPVRSRLAWLCAEKHQHARFLNMLSLMEHIGSRKIMTSQTRGPLGIEVLKHLAEEARHAYFFKRQAERLGVFGPCDYSQRTTMVPSAARMYFGRLDAGINRVLGDDAHVEVPYLYVSMIIELRAIWTYALYHDVLVEQGTGLSLKSILAEEELHLPQMAERLEALGEDLNARVPGFVDLEGALFRNLWKAVEQDCQPHLAVVA